MSLKKPSGLEGEYFAREEFFRQQAIEAKKCEEMAEEDKAHQKELHFMKCPKCGMDLVTIDFKGVQIDRCPCCEGVWLDTGELETISEMEPSRLDKLFNIFKPVDWKPDL